MSEARHILVVDDDARLRDLLQHYLRDNGYDVTCASDAADARKKLESLLFDMMVVDVMMPGETGMEFVASLPEDAPSALMLTALAETNDKIKGLESGADDYLVKPFEPRELLLRIQAILRRAAPPESQQPTRIAFGGFVFDVASGQLVQQGEPVYLTTAERECLELLGKHLGEPVSRETMAELAGGSNTRSVDVMVNRLRKKIEPEPARPVYLQTVRHAGYVLQAERVL